MDNSAAKDTLEKSWVHNICIKPSETIDRTEQERLLLSFIAQKYYKMKCSNTEQCNVHTVRRRMRLKQHWVTAHSPPSPHWEVQREETLISRVLNLSVGLLNLFFSRLTDTWSAENYRIGADTDPEYQIDASLILYIFVCEYLQHTPWYVSKKPTALPIVLFC